MLKRIFSLLTALTLTLSAVPVLAEETAEVKEPVLGFGYEHKVTAEPIVFLDFEDYNMGSGNTGFSSQQGVMHYPVEGPLGGTAITYNGAGQPVVKFPETISEGTYLLSFDIRRSEAAAWCYMRFNWRGTGTYYDTFGMNGGKIGYNSNWSIKGIPFTPGEWCHVNMFLDFDKSKIDYYINNEYVTSSTSLGPVTTFGFMTEGAATQVTTLDNIAMYEMSVGLREELVDLGINMPDEHKSDFNVNIGSKYHGNLFTSFDEVELEISLQNKLSWDMQYDMSWYVKNYRGDLICEGEQKGLTIAASDTFVHKLQPSVDKYDIYTIYLTIDPYLEGSLTIERDKEFSVASAPTPGYRSDYIGHTIHTGRWTRWEEVERQIDVAGMNFLRTDYGWGSYEPQKGQYGGKGEAERYTTDYYQQVKDNNMQAIAIFNPLNSIYAPSYRELSRSEDGLAALEKAAETFAREYKDRFHIIELGNEINHKSIDELTPEEYAIISARAYKGIKKGNPDAIVLCHGVSRSAGDWIYRYLIALDEPVCDVISIHLYQEAGTPEMKKWDDYCMEVRAGMERAGCGDMELWLTEGLTSAHSSYSTEQQHGVNLVRQLIRVLAYKPVDKFLFYQIQTAETNTADIESYFGILRGRTVNNANGPKQSYMALTNYVARTEIAVFENDITYDNNVWIYRLKKPDGSRVLMMYADRDVETVTLDLGTNSGTLFDINGNPTSLKTNDGKFTFTFSEEPIYFEYNGEKFEKCENKVTVDKTLIEVAKGNTDEFNLKVTDGAKVSIKTRDNITAELTQNGNDAKIKFTVNEMPTLTTYPGLGYIANVDYTQRHHNFGTQIYRDHIEVFVEKDGNTFAHLKLPMEYVFAAADVSMQVQPYDNTNTRYWKGIVTVKNNKTEPISGTIKMTSPSAITEEVGILEVPKIGVGESKDIVFNIPAEYSHGYQKYIGVFTTADGEEIQFALGDHPRSYGYKAMASTAIGVIEKTKNQTPVIDGVIDEAEWKLHKITDFDKSQVSYGSQGVITAGVVEAETFGKDADYGGMADFSGTVYAQWDDEYFYAAAIVYDDVHWNHQDPRSSYFNDHFYYVLCPTTTQRHDTRIEFFLSDYFEHEAYTEEERHGHIYRNWSEMYDVTVGGIIPETEDGPQVEVVRKDNVTIYETRMPLSQIMSPETIERKQTSLTFQIRDYDGDRDKTWGYGGWYVLVDSAE